MAGREQPASPVYTEDGVWHVIVRKDNGYPLTVYVDRGRAEHVAKANGERVVVVCPVLEE